MCKGLNACMQYSPTVATISYVAAPPYRPLQHCSSVTTLGKCSDSSLEGNDALGNST